MCNKKELIFSIYIIHHLAAEWKKSPVDVYKILDDTHIIDDYVFGCYDALHTQGNQALVSDLTEFVKERGVNL